MLEQQENIQNKWQIGDIMRVDYDEDMETEEPYYCPWGMSPRQYLDGFYSYITRHLKPLVPLGGEDGKMPFVKWGDDDFVFSENDLKKLLAPERYEKKPVTGFGVLTGKRSGITTLDLDDPNDLEWAIENFGDTPYWVRTPRGGYHLYYSYSGENCHRGICGREADIRGDGGFAVIQNSYCPSKGVLYERFKGTEDDLKNLPCMKNYQELVLSVIQPNQPSEINFPTATIEQAIQRSNFGRVEPIGTIIKEGARNDTLFYWLKDHQLKTKGDFESLLACALEINEQMFEPPLPEAEVTRTAGSVFRYFEEDSLFGEGERFITIPFNLFQSLVRYPQEFCLLVFLRSCWHKSPDKEVPVCYLGIGEAFQWDRKTVQRAVEKLIKLGYLERVGKVPSRRGRPINTFKIRYSKPDNVQETTMINLL